MVSPANYIALSNRYVLLNISPLRVIQTYHSGDALELVSHLISYEEDPMDSHLSENTVEPVTETMREHMRVDRINRSPRHADDDSDAD